MNDSLIIRPSETPLLQSPLGGLNQRVDRRSFIQAMITSAVACLFLPGAMRRWKSLWVPAPVDPGKFAQFLLDELPRYEEMIIRDITPSDGWIGHVIVGQWDPFDGNTHVLDRFRSVQPDMLRFHPVRHKLLT